MSIFTFSNNSFEGQYRDETVLLLLRRHWFSLLVTGVGFVVLALVPVAVYYGLRGWLAEWGLNGCFWFLTAVYFVLWWNSLFYQLMIYLLDVWLVTDHRIVDSEQKGFFHRVVSEAKLTQVQDVSVRTIGPIQTFLDFGDVEVQTAGTQERFLFKQVPHPNRVKNAILQANNQFLAKHPGGTGPEEDR